ncbi:MAG: sulfatase-like hydrolase/transferase [Limisphaerales bacterium]
MRASLRLKRLSITAGKPLLLAGVLACIFPPAPAAAATKPNLIFIIADDMGWGDLGVFYQNSRGFATNRAAPAFATPHLDTFAAEGMQLRRHYTAAPVCAPARASLLLGVHQGHANVRDNQFDKALENNHTLGTVLKQAGYATAVIGKWGIQGSGLPAPARPQLRGFDYFFGYLAHGAAHLHYPKESGANVYDDLTLVTPDLDKCYSTDFITARTKKWIMDQQATNAAQPFFVYLAFTAPHARLDVPTQAYPAGGGTNGGLQWLGTPGQMINTATGTINTWIHPDYTNATYDHDNNPGTAEIAWPDYAKRHATMMRRIDDAVADLVQTLKDLNLDTNTLVVLTSDNGPHNEAGSGGSYTYNPTFFDSFGPMDGIKRDSWEGGMREPTLARWPGRIAAGTTNFTASQFHDWLPTFCELAGVPAPARTDGVSLVPTLTGAGTQRPNTIYVEYFYNGSTPNYSEFEASRRGNTRSQEQVIHLDGYKGIRYNVAAATDNFAIYDTLNDAKEAANLAGTSAYFTNLQQRMKDRVLQLRRPGGDVTRPYDAELVPPVAVTNVEAGLDYRAFEASFPWVPDFTPITPVTNGTCSGVDLAVRTGNDNIGLEFTGYLDVPAAGTYTIYLNTDGRAFLRLHDAAVIDADFGYTNGTEVSAAINLQSGRHPLRLGYVRGTGGTPALTLQWSGPGIAKQAIPAANLLRVAPAAAAPPTAANDTANTPRNTPVAIDVLANDTPGSGPGPLRVVNVESPTAGTAATNLAGQIVYTPNAGFLGEDVFSYAMTDGVSNATATVTVKVFFADGLIWFPFNQTSGLTTEDAGGAFTGNLHGFTNDPAQWVAGRWNRAVNFTGAGHVAIAGFNGILGASNRTCAAWVKTTGTGQMPIIAWGPNSNSNKWTFLIHSGTARIEVTGGFLHGATLVNDGQWHHLACVFTNNGVPNVTNALLYVDGVLETNFLAVQSRTINTTASGDVTIGADIPSGQNRRFTGVIDEPRIYDRALSAAEITALYHATNQSAVAWHRRYFGNAPVDWPGPDNAGLPRLLDYAFGVEPWTATPAQLAISGGLVAGAFQVQFPRRVAGTSELIYQLQSSPDLQNWSPWSAVELPATPLTTPGLESARFQSPGAPTNASFIRLHVSLP